MSRFKNAKVRRQLRRAAKRKSRRLSTLRYNFVPADPLFLAAAIEFVIEAVGCGDAECRSGEQLQFLESFQRGELHRYPQFFRFCEAKGLPVDHTNVSDSDDVSRASPAISRKGDDVYPDFGGGFLHETCCGPEAEGWVDADGNPLTPGNPRPKPFKWSEY